MSGNWTRWHMISKQKSNCATFTGNFTTPPSAQRPTSCEAQTATNWPLKFKKSLIQISNNCETFNTKASAPRRFKRTVVSDQLSFNHLVQVDTMFIRQKPIIDLIHEASNYTAAGFLRSQKTNDIWKAIRELCIMTYADPRIIWT